MRDRDKNTVNGAGLLAVFAKRAGRVEETLVYPSLHGRWQTGHDFMRSMLQGGFKTLGRDEIVRHEEWHLQRGAMGIEERVAVAVAQFVLLRRARKVRANATAGVECTAPLSAVHEDPALSPLHIEKGLASTVGRLLMVSLQPAKYQESETHFKQALHLHRKVEASRGTLLGAAARAAAGKLAEKAADEGLYDTLVVFSHLYGLMCKNETSCRCTRRCCRRCAAILRMRARLSFRGIYPIFSLPWATCTSVNIEVKSPMDLKEISASAPMQTLYWRRRSASSVPSRKMAW